MYSVGFNFAYLNTVSQIIIDAAEQIKDKSDTQNPIRQSMSRLNNKLNPPQIIDSTSAGIAAAIPSGVICGTRVATDVIIIPAPPQSSVTADRHNRIIGTIFFIQNYFIISAVVCRVGEQKKLTNISCGSIIIIASGICIV